MIFCSYFVKYDYIQRTKCVRKKRTNGDTCVEKVNTLFIIIKESLKEKYRTALLFT